MSQNTTSSVTPTRELRLRRWARENYTHPRNRQEGWNSIVLEEMQVRDQELLEEFSQPITMSHGYVPLAPTNYQILHTAHASIRQPHIAKATTHQKADCEMMLPAEEER